MKNINLEYYFKKLKIVAPALAGSTYEEKINFLKLLYVVHVQTFPYSNFELRKIARQHPIQRNSLSFFDYKKLLSSEHGGYCFQTAALLSDVLSQLDYQVSYCSARVLLGAYVNSPEVLALPSTHIVLMVTIDDKKFLLDPGLGSSAPRFPVPITEKNELIVQNDETFKFYPTDGVHVLEKKTRQGWFRLMQTDLVPISQKQVAMNLLKLECHPAHISIRDAKTVIGIITEHGRKSLVWDVQSKQLKYSQNEKDVYTQKILADFNEGHKVLVEEFGINHISVETLEIYCTETVLPQPIKPWTVNFPLDKFELKEMEKNLKPLVLR